LIIEETKKKMGVGIIEVILLRSHKKLIMKAFNHWSLSIKPQNRTRSVRNQSLLPPKTQVNVIENSSKKKKVELLFTLPPTPN